MGVPTEAQRARPRIELVKGVFTHNGKPCAVIFTRDLVSIACSDITPEALKELASRYTAYFDHPVWVQKGDEICD